MRPMARPTDLRRRRRDAIGQAVDRSPRTAIPGLYFAESAYAGFGGYTGVVQAGGACADMILREG